MRVNGINPGAVETDRLAARLRAAMKENNVGDVARAVCYLAAPLTRHIQATLLDISGGEGIAL
ncbi:MAG: hypothetical protein ACT4N4_04890 [Rhodospirillales bacterium]